jgi:hypothetical protein
MMPILKCFHVYDGRIQGMSSTIAIDSPCVELKGHNFTVNADLFVKAIDACESEPTYSFTEGKIHIKSGAYKVSLNLEEKDVYPLQTVSEASFKPIGGNVVSIFSKVLPFVNPKTDMNHWSNGALVHGKYVYATNNVVIVRAELPFYFDGVVNISVDILEEICRIQAQPISYSNVNNRLVFMYEDGSWIMGNALSTDWPSSIDTYIPTDVDAPVPPNFAFDVDKLAPFAVDDTIHFYPDKIAVGCDDNDASVGNYIFPRSAISCKWLKELLKIITDIDVGGNPMPFVGENIAGVVTRKRHE